MWASMCCCNEESGRCMWGVVVAPMSLGELWKCITKKNAGCLVKGWEALHVRHLGLEIL